MHTSPHVLALTSAFFSAVATILIQQELRRSSFYAAFWINVTVGVLGYLVYALIRPERF